ncbi:FAD-dependent oxidoreductase [Salinarchaeum sp. IM2453]|uniref:NAD(P)/FAD-dependent oxidoreductase n=1 Tax=Salinarchaeum sp. IM2453 TaxID=2862870 RepID=UPI001C82C5DA|nr:FAD-dependent oxidoreductase [Salinarchaeum sp. IM2453]QZA88640.1 FAD-dependent oxidoreductase [Salinarchaeum sp. IM2453]
MKSYVIIGDGIAGSTAAETLRERQPDADITIVTDEGEALYNRILIKEHAKGKLPEVPISIHEEDWYEERDINLEINTLVVDVDVDEHVVRTHDGETLEYDKLLIASGGTPTNLPVENADADGIHHFWTFEDAREIKQHAEESEEAVVVGAGLIGVDLAGVCGAQGLDSKYLMRGKCWWRYALSQEGAEIVHEGLRDIGVEPVFESGVDHFEVDEGGHVTAAVDPNGERFDCDMVGVGIGLDYNTEFMQGTGLETDNGIVVDEYMQTNLEDVYAAGDVTTFYDTITGTYEKNGSWDSAKEQGKIVGINMAEDDQAEEFRMVSTYSVTHFDFPFLSIGHPTEGEEYLEEFYDDQVWRRLALKDGKIIGAVLIGDLAPQNAIKTLIDEEVDIRGKEDAVLAESLDVSEVAPSLEQ